MGCRRDLNYHPHSEERGITQKAMEIPNRNSIQDFRPNNFFTPSRFSRPDFHHRLSIIYYIRAKGIHESGWSCDRTIRPDRAKLQPNQRYHANRNRPTGLRFFTHLSEQHSSHMWGAVGGRNSPLTQENNPKKELSTSLLSQGERQFMRQNGLIEYHKCRHNRQPGVKNQT